MGLTRKPSTRTMLCSLGRKQILEMSRELRENEDFAHRRDVQIVDLDGIVGGRSRRSLFPQKRLGSNETIDSSVISNATSFSDLDASRKKYGDEYGFFVDISASSEPQLFLLKDVQMEYCALPPGLEKSKIISRTWKLRLREACLPPSSVAR